MRKQIIYRKSNGKFISKKEYEARQKAIQNENWICIKLTAKIMIVIIFSVSLLTLIQK